MLKLIGEIPLNMLFRRLGRPRRLPMNLTLSLTNRCNARCRTCNIHTRPADELSLSEYQKIFRSLGRHPFWVTFSGGEPFLRTDLGDITKSLYDHCRPRIINIPTNGLLVQRIAQDVNEMASHCRKAHLVINLSVDEIGERHDQLRGVRGNFQKVMETHQALRELSLANLSIGFHTVISRFNVQRIPEIYRHLKALRPDSYITEIAENRVELGTMDADIAPSPAEYREAVDFLIQEMETGRFARAGKVTRAFRIEYYRQAAEWLEGSGRGLPCYAGIASAQIAPDGDVWSCCMKAEPLGNLKENNYDFHKVWRSRAARDARQEIVRTKCRCPLANAGYTNMLHHPGSLFRVARHWLR